MGIRKPHFKEYIVFVQSKGIGQRPLLKGTSILYEVCTSITPHSLSAIL